MTAVGRLLWNKEKATQIVYWLRERQFLRDIRTYLEDALDPYSSDCLFLHTEKQKSPIIRSAYLLQRICKRLIFCCVVSFWFFRSVQMRPDASEVNWMYLSAQLVQMGVQEKCFTAEASLFPMELANTFRKKFALTVHGERRQKTAAKSCEILSHTSHYPASKRSLKYSVLENQQTFTFFFSFSLSVTTNFSRARPESSLTSPISRFHISVVFWILALNVFIFPPWNPFFNDDLGLFFSFFVFVHRRESLNLYLVVLAIFSPLPSLFFGDCVCKWVLCMYLSLSLLVLTFKIMC